MGLPKFPANALKIDPAAVGMGRGLRLRTNWTKFLVIHCRRTTDLNLLVRDHLGSIDAQGKTLSTWILCKDGGEAIHLLESFREY